MRQSQVAKQHCCNFSSPKQALLCVSSLSFRSLSFSCRLRLLRGLSAAAACWADVTRCELDLRSLNPNAPCRFKALALLFVVRDCPSRATPAPSQRLLSAATRGRPAPKPLAKAGFNLCTPEPSQLDVDALVERGTWSASNCRSTVPALSSLRRSWRGQPCTGLGGFKAPSCLSCVPPCCCCHWAP